LLGTEVVFLSPWPVLLLFASGKIHGTNYDPNQTKRN